MLLLHHKTLKGSRNIQGFTLIRAVCLYFLWRVGGWFSLKKIQILEKKIYFIFFSFVFFLCITAMYLCIMYLFFMYYVNLKMQSEHSGLRPNTSSLVSY